MVRVSRSFDSLGFAVSRHFFIPLSAMKNSLSHSGVNNEGCLMCLYHTNAACDEKLFLLFTSSTSAIKGLFSVSVAQCLEKTVDDEA